MRLVPRCLSIYRLKSVGNATREPQPVALLEMTDHRLGGQRVPPPHSNPPPTVSPSMLELINLSGNRALAVDRNRTLSAGECAMYVLPICGACLGGKGHSR